MCIRDSCNLVCFDVLLITFERITLLTCMTKCNVIASNCAVKEMLSLKVGVQYTYIRHWFLFMICDRAVQSIAECYLFFFSTLMSGRNGGKLLIKLKPNLGLDARKKNSIEKILKRM